jgi:heptosyltransferase-3
VTAASPVGTRRPTMLLARSDGLGDAVLSMGLIRGLRAGFPDWRIVLAVPGFQVDLFADCPWVDVVIKSEKIRYQTGLRGDAMDVIRTQVARLHEAIGITPPDVAIDLSMWPHPQDSASAFVKASGAPLTVAAVDNWVDDRMHGWLDRGHQIVVRVPLGHEIDRYRALAGRLGVEAAETRWWDLRGHIPGALDILGKDEKWQQAPKLVFGVGATDNFRKWRPQRFGEIAARALDRGLGVVVLGGPDAVDEGRIIRAVGGPGVIDATGRLSLIQSAALLTQRDIYVGNDTGTMHVAAAAGVACVEISPHPMSGDPGVGTSPVRFAPHGVPAVILRPSVGLVGCDRQCSNQAAAPHCIDIITVEDVWDAVLELLPAAVAAPAGPSLGGLLPTGQLPGLPTMRVPLLDETVGSV